MRRENQRACRAHPAGSRRPHGHLEQAQRGAGTDTQEPPDLPPVPDTLSLPGLLRLTAGRAPHPPIPPGLDKEQEAAPVVGLPQGGSRPLPSPDPSPARGLRPLCQARPAGCSGHVLRAPSHVPARSGLVRPRGHRRARRPALTRPRHAVLCSFLWWVGVGVKACGFPRDQQRHIKATLCSGRHLATWPLL